MKFGACIVLVVGLLVAGVACERWKYNECRKVGHGKMYCIVRIGGDK